MGLHQHLKDAIKLNTERKHYYTQKTAGQSLGLSQRLILLESLGLPVGFYFDVKAKRFNKRGIMIVQHDFVAMDVADKARPALYQNEFSSAFKKVLKQNLHNWTRALSLQMKESKDFFQLYAAAKAYLEVLAQDEQHQNNHLCMTKHLLESFAFIAKNASAYAEQSEGETRALSRQMLSLHLNLVQYAVWFDVQANHCHQLGAGILYNDLPEFPDL